MRLKITHNMEMAHRLSKDTTKCKQIHGHGMQVTVYLQNLVQDENTGMCKTRFGRTMEFGSMKRAFRNYIDNTYDHRLVLNQEDLWAQPVVFYDTINWEEGGIDVPAGTIHNGEQQFLPGLSVVPGEPTVENLAKWIGEWAAATFQCDVLCSIEETRTNGAEVAVMWTGAGTKVAQ